MSERIGIFVDVGNLYYNINKKWEGRRLDYAKYLKHVTSEGSQIKAYAYGTKIDGVADNFVSCLKFIGFEPVFKIIEKDTWFSWEVGLAIDMLRLSYRLDTIILGSSSRNMTPVINELANGGINVTVFAALINKELRLSANKCIEITEDMLEAII